AVDIIITHQGKVLLIKRRNPPFAGMWALPGGMVEYGESVEDAARREALEETGVRVDNLTLVGIYSDPKRDPRGHVVSICFKAEVCGEAEPRPGADVVEARWVETPPTEGLAFDHTKMLKDSGVWRD
ncbi:MAG: NUDIX hydrolase, partial [Methanobacteriota archaeon]